MTLTCNLTSYSLKAGRNVYREGLGHEWVGYRIKKNKKGNYSVRVNYYATEWSGTSYHTKKLTVRPEKDSFFHSKEWGNTSIINKWHKTAKDKKGTNGISWIEKAALRYANRALKKFPKGSKNRQCAEMIVKDLQKVAGSSVSKVK